MIDVLVCFDATDHEPDNPHPSNVVQLAKKLDAIPLYEPGVGTRLGTLRRIGSLLGTGGSDRIEDQLDRLAFPYFAGKRISVIGGSRGACAAREFTHFYRERFPERDPIHACILFDHVCADGWHAAKRALPRLLWSVGEYPAPNAMRSLHLRAVDGKSNRFYLSDKVATREVIACIGMNHTQVLHSPRALGEAYRWAICHGLRASTDAI